MITRTKTVEDYMLDELCARGLNTGEYERALEFAKRELDEDGFSAHATMSRKQGEGILVKDCWNTLAIEYNQTALDGLYRLIEHHTLTWCINYMHSKS